MNKKQLAIHILIILLFAFVALISFRHLLASPGVIGVANEWNLPPFSGQFDDKISRDLSAWKSFPDLGAPGTPTVGLYFDLLQNLLYKTGADGDFVSKLLSVLLMTLAGTGAFVLARKLSLSAKAAVISGLLYMLSPIIFDRFVMGHLVIIMDYALMPLVLTLFASSLERRVGFTFFLGSGLLLTLGLGHITSYFLVFTAMLLYAGVHAAFSKSWGKFGLGLRNAAFFFIVPVLVASYWIIPLLGQVLVGRLGESVGSAIGDLPAQLLLAASPSMEITNTVRLQGFHAAFFSQVVASSRLLTAASYLPAALSAVAFLLRPRSRLAVLAASLALVGVVLASAQVGPLDNLYVWLFEHLPFLSAFRDPSYWIHLATIGYALLLGSLAAGIMDMLQEVSFDVLVKVKQRVYALTGWLVTIPLAASVLAFGAPFLTGNFCTFLQTVPQYTEDHRQLWASIHDDPEDFRPLDTQGPYPNLYEGLRRWGYDMMTQYQGKAGMYYAKVYDPQIVRFMYKTMYENRTDQLGQLLGLMNVKYLTFDPQKRPGVTEVNFLANMVFPSEAYTNEKLMAALGSQKDIVLQRRIGPISVYQNQDYSPHITALNRAALYAGGLDGLIGLTYTDSFKPRDLGLVFSNQLTAAAASELMALPNTTTVIQEGHLDELLAALSPSRRTFHLFDYTDPDDMSLTGWSPLWESWHNWLYQANPDRAVYTLAPSRLSVPVSITLAGEYYLLVEPYYGVARSAVQVLVDGTQVERIVTRSPSELGFRWRRLGPLTLAQGTHTIDIQSGEGENAIGGLVLVPVDEMEEAQRKTEGFVAASGAVLVVEFDTPTRITAELSGASGGLAVSSLYGNRTPITEQITAPAQGDYRLYLRAASQTQTSGIMVDAYGQQFTATLGPLSEGFQWYDLGTVSISAGTHEISVTPDGTDVTYMDMLLLVDSRTPTPQDPPPVITQSRLSASEYTVQAESKEPFFIFFSERFDADWQLKAASGDAPPDYPGYSFGNLYFVDQTGKLDLALEYSRQRAYTIYLVFSFCFLALAVLTFGALMFLRARRKPNIKS